MTSHETLSVRVPFRIRKHGGRKLMVSPDGASVPTQPRIDSTLVKAIARAHRWKRLLEQGEYGSLTELAKTEKINLSYLARVLRLTLLAPDIVEAILDGQQPNGLQIDDLLKPLPLDWTAQRAPLVD